MYVLCIYLLYTHRTQYVHIYIYQAENYVYAFILLAIVCERRLTMSKPQLYYTAISPPSRAVVTTAKLVNVELDLIETNLLKDEHLKAEFLKVLYLLLFDLPIT